jgi:hypothetical protein
MCRALDRVAFGQQWYEAVRVGVDCQRVLLAVLAVAVDRDDLPLARLRRNRHEVAG